MTITTAVVRTEEVTAAPLAAPAFLALPEGAGPFPGIVVIHELFGLNDNIRDITRRWRSTSSGAATAGCAWP